MWCFFNAPAHTEIYTYCHTLSLPGALPVALGRRRQASLRGGGGGPGRALPASDPASARTRLALSRDGAPVARHAGRGAGRRTGPDGPSGPQDPYGEDRDLSA